MGSLTLLGEVYQSHKCLKVGENESTRIPSISCSQNDSFQKRNLEHSRVEWNISSISKFSFPLTYSWCGQCKLSRFLFSFPWRAPCLSADMKSHDSTPHFAWHLFAKIMFAIIVCSFLQNGDCVSLVCQAFLFIYFYRQFTFRFLGTLMPLKGFKEY